MIDGILTAIKYLVVWHTGDTVETYGPRLLLSMLVISNAAALAAHIALACGAFPGIFPGFATATDMTHAASTLDTLLDREDGAKIKDDLRDNCRAIAAGGDAYPSAAAMSDDLNAWASKHHQPFSMQPSGQTCAELGIPLPH